MDLAIDASTPASLDGDLDVAVVVFDRGEKGDDPVTSGPKCVATNSIERGLEPPIRGSVSKPSCF